MVPHSVKMLPHRVQILAHFVRILAHCWQMLAHCVKMLARDLGEPLIGHRQDTQSGSMGTHRRLKQRHRDSKNAHCSSNEPHCVSNGRLCDLFLPLFTKSEGPAFFIPLPQFTMRWS